MQLHTLYSGFSKITYNIRNGIHENK